MNPRLFLAGLVLLAAPAFGADIDGKWSGSLETPQGSIQVGFSFKADGATLTGTSTGPDGAEMKINNGKVNGNKVSFDVMIDFGGMPFTISYTGEVMGENLKLVLDFAGMPIEIALKKAA